MSYSAIDYFKGLGTEDSPFLIEKESDLIYLSDNFFYFDENCYFKQVNHLDFERVQFPPIGSCDSPFEGNYDGNGKLISNLVIKPDSSIYCGLFGAINKAKICNVIIKDIDLYSDNRSGGIAGKADESIILNCYVSGALNSYDAIGGIIGYASDCLIKNCYFIGNVESRYGYTAGIVGSCMGKSDVINCCIEGSMITSKSGYPAAGICGSSTGNILNCYIDACINGNSNPAAGIVGYHLDPYKIIENCFISGYVKSKDKCDELIASLEEKYVSDYTVRNCYICNYFDLKGKKQNVHNFQSTIINLSSLDRSSYEGLGWNFEEDWDWISKHPYPKIVTLFNSL